MNILSRQKQIEIIAALCEGVGQRAVTREVELLQEYENAYRRLPRCNERRA